MNRDMEEIRHTILLICSKLVEHQVINTDQYNKINKRISDGKTIKGTYEDVKKIIYPMLNAKDKAEKLTGDLAAKVDSILKH